MATSHPPRKSQRLSARAEPGSPLLTSAPVMKAAPPDPPSPDPSSPDRRGAVRDITGRDDITALLIAFYTEAFADDLLGPVFLDVAHLDLAEHLPVLADFWETVLFQAGLYRRDALQVHRHLHTQTPLTSAHFRRWLTLWTATVEQRHTGPTAQLAQRQAARIADAMNHRLNGPPGPPTTDSHPHPYPAEGQHR